MMSLKTVWRSVFLATTMAAAAVAAPLGTAFTYQGSLEDGGQKPTGVYNLRATLWTEAAGGAQVGPTVNLTNVDVFEGAFTVKLDFGAQFAGDKRYLQIAVNGPGDGAVYTTLSPRQELTANPYALHALGGAFWAAGASGSIFNTNTGSVGINTNAPSTAYALHVVDGARTNAVWAQGSVAISKGSGDVGVGLRVTRSSSAGPILTSTSTEIDGSDIDAVGLLGDTSLRLNRNSTGNVLLAGAGGFVGVGQLLPEARFHMTGTDLSVDDGHLSNDDMIIEDSDAVLGLYSSAGGTWGSAIALGEINDFALTSKWAIARQTSGAGSELHFTAGPSANYADNDSVMTLDDDGDVGIGVTNPTSRLHVFAFENESLGNFAQWGSGGGVRIATILNNNNNHALEVVGANPNVAALSVSGTASIDVLEIYGADVAERFPASEAMKPGQVVEIDPDNAGQLRVSRGQYNHRVAGVVSGAGDIPAGTILGNMPGSEGMPAIALSGRVWVDCDATTHAIGVGDLLTTSDTPGHAMAVRDRAQATGATLGKAMTALPKGERGMVLVLINLQ